MQFQLGRGIAQAVPEVDVLLGGQDLVAVVLIVVLRVLTVEQFQLEVVEHGHQVPLQLEHSITFAGAEGTEGHHGVFDFSPILVKLGIDKTVILELLERYKADDVWLERCSTFQRCMF